MNPTTTKRKNYYGTVITSILMYTTIQLKQNNYTSCRFANTTLLQLWRIIITKMRRHWKRQALKKVVPDATTTCPCSVVPTEQHRSRRRETPVAQCVLVSFRFVCGSKNQQLVVWIECYVCCNVWTSIIYRADVIYGHAIFAPSMDFYLNNTRMV